MKRTVQAYWQSCSPRDRVMLLVGGVCCFFYLFYAVLYAPLASRVADGKSQWRAQQATLDWMHQQPHGMGKASKHLSNSALLTALGRSLNQASFHSYHYQLEQTNTGDIQLSFDEVPYLTWVSWLWTLSEREAFLIKQCHVNSTKTSGIVKVVVILSA